MTGVEAAVVGAAGALAGALAYCALLPALARVPYGIGRWYTGELWVGPGRPAAVVAAVAVLIAVSATTTLRRVATSPLGVAQQADPRRTRVVRLLLFAAVLVFIRASMGGGQVGAGRTVALMALFYGAFWLFGPWAVDRLGRVAGRFASRPATLLAARRLSDDAGGAWRTVSGLVLAGFVAGFFTVGHLGVIGFDFRGQIAVPTASAAEARHAAAEARTLLRAAGVTATVGTGGDGLILDPGQGVTVHVTGGPAQLDTALTVLQPLSPGQLPYTQDYVNADGDAYTERLADLGTALLAVSFVVATASAGLTAAADVLDRRRVYGLLRLAGTPLEVLDRARVRAKVLPLVVLAGGTTATGIYAAYRFNKAVGGAISASGAVQLAVCATVGALAMFAAIGGSRPLLRKVTAHPAQTAD